MAITDNQKAVAQSMIDAFDNLCIVSGYYKGEPVAFVATHEKTEKGEHSIVPIFIVLTSSMYNNCLGPNGESLNGCEVKNGSFACPRCRAINKYTKVSNDVFRCECGLMFSLEKAYVVRYSACPHCGHIESSNNEPQPHYFTPCVNPNCPSTQHG